MKILAFVLPLAWLVAACNREPQSPPSDLPAGAERKTDTKLLETGANVLQDRTPVEQIGVYLNGFHVMKDDPRMHMEAHHYCNEKNEDLSQCVIFDGNTKDANLIGVEYIISERLFETLPPGERRYWHPHNYEIFSGTLVGPGLPDAAEKAFMRKKINSYGKTWHLWDTGHYGREASHDLPYGEPLLAWSYNADGEAPPEMIRERDARLGVSTAEKREQRADMASLARPQEGVDALAAVLKGTGRPPGVTPKASSSAPARPRH
jgi:hypothetical protein